MSKKFNAHASSGNFDAVGVGAAVSGNPVAMGKAYNRVKDLAAHLAVLAETNTITLAAQWQVSEDQSTWYDVANAPNNPAATVLATGTAGGDSLVTKVVPAPEGIYGYQYARVQVVVGAVTGTTSDTYAIGYTYRQLTGAEVGI